MTTAREIFTNVRMTQLGDSDGITWPMASLIIAFNSASKLLVLMRPDSHTTIKSVNLTQGSRQFIPNDGVRLLNVVRNSDSTGGVGRAIRLVRRSDLDAMSPDWHLATGPLVHEYCFDPRSPKHFYVYPAPSSTSIWAEIEYSSLPSEITEDTIDSEIGFDPIFDQVLIELMLYKLLSGDNTGGTGGTAHMQAASALLSGNVNSATATDPKQDRGFTN